jgi:hypothetical protein
MCQDDDSEDPKGKLVLRTVQSFDEAGGMEGTPISVARVHVDSSGNYPFLNDLV